MTNENLPANPIELFTCWFMEAKAQPGMDATAMVLATATSQGKPSARVVLLKGFDANGFVFYTNLGSRKAQELQQNPQAALDFYWPMLEKQIRIEGRVSPVSNSEADHYFASRARGSQVGAWASKQSQPMQEPDELKQRVEIIAQKFEQNPIPRPVFWSGFCLQPERIEFWRQGEHRLHTRIVYQKNADDLWNKSYLFP